MEYDLMHSGKAIADAFKELLSAKHLYQYVQIDTAFMDEAVKEELRQASEPSSHYIAPRFPSIAEGKKMLTAEFKNLCWRPLFEDGEGKKGTTSSETVEFYLPTIHTYCDMCSARWPFDAVDEPRLPWQGVADGQCFCLPYQCQSCKGPPIWFLVSRDGLKLRLCGRDPIEVLPTPKVLPKHLAKFYSDALIAHHAGQTLAGLFLLRVFVEQFWHSVPDVQKVLEEQPKATGDEQGNAYQTRKPCRLISRTGFRPYQVCILT
jgi:hypothetical protein